MDVKVVVLAGRGVSKRREVRGLKKAQPVELIGPKLAASVAVGWTFGLELLVVEAS